MIPATAGQGPVALSLLSLDPGTPGGSESYARALIDRFARQPPPGGVVLLATRTVAPTLAGSGLDVHVVRSYRPGRGAPRRLLAMALGSLPLSPLARDVPPDLGVVHYPLTVPVPHIAATASVVTLHDLLHHEHPAFFSPQERAWRRLAYDTAARRAARVITVSEHARAQIVDRLGLEAYRVVAIPHGVDHDLFRPEPAELDAELELPGRFLLYPANAWPHKNHERLVAAFLRAAVPDLHLVLTGQTYGRPVPGADHPSIHHLGHVPWAHLPALYRRAEALVFPSLFEGFGMPILEAMASGCPVAASDRAAVAETCGDAAILFDPEDEEAIAAAVTRLGDASVRERLRGAGLARAGAFTWDRSAARHLTTYAEASAAAA